MFDLPGLSFAILVAGGGAYGYCKAVSGFFFGILLALGAYQLGQSPRNAMILFGSSAALGAIMVFRFIRTGKLMPAGIFACLSLLMAFRCAYIMLV